MPTVEERLDKAGSEFKKLNDRITELEQRFIDVAALLVSLEKKFELVKDPVKMRRKEMIEIYKWFLDRLMKDSNEANKA